MSITTKAIKSSDENICGAAFAAVGAGVAIGSQNLTFNAFSNDGDPSTVMAVLGLASKTATATIQVDAKLSVSFNVVEVEDAPPVNLDPKSQVPAVPHKNAKVTAVVLYGGEVMFTKSYLLQEKDTEGNWKNTSESGVYVGGGFSISMPTQMGAPYQATFQRTDLHSVRVRISASTSGITANARVAFPLESKASGFTTREREAIDAALRHYEGNTDFMYLDDRGLVTVGVGFMLPDENAVLAYPFLDFEDNPASDAQKRSEWRAIHSLAASHIPSWYEDHTNLYLPSEFIDSKVSELIDDSFSALSRIFPDVGQFPSAARVALQDMVYNLGERGLQNYSRLRAAIARRDWRTAAAESHRVGPNEERNNAIRDLFLSAANGGDF